MSRLPPVMAPWWPPLKRRYTEATRFVAPANLRLSRAVGGWLPRSVLTTIEEAEAAGTAQVWPVFEPEALLRSPPVGEPANDPTLMAQVSELVPRAIVALLPGGRVMGRHRGVITKTGALVAELSPYFGRPRSDCDEQACPTRSAREHPLFLNPFPSSPTPVAGTLGVLAARGDMGYYHFLLDVLPRLAILEACPESPTVDRWYVPARLGFQRELLELIGMNKERVLDSDSTPHVSAERLVVPTLPDPDLRTPPWAVAFLRRRLMRDAARIPGRRIYVTRGRTRHSRIVINEPEVLALLGRHGFSVVKPDRLSVIDQIRMFAEADLIVAPHGAALSNLAFASPGARLIEMFAPDFVQGCYWKLMGTIPDTRYRYLIGRGPRPRDGGMWGVASDIDIDVDALSRLLNELL